MYYASSDDVQYKEILNWTKSKFEYFMELEFEDMMMVDGRCGMMDGYITSTVLKTQKPIKDDQSNFGEGYGYQYGPVDNTIEVLIDDNWWVFFENDEAIATKLAVREGRLKYYIENPDGTFEETYKASGIGSNTNDYFDTKDAVLFEFSTED